MSPSIESIAVEDLDKDLTPKPDVVESNDEIVEPVLDIETIKEATKPKRVYKPRVKKQIVEQPSPPNSPVVIPERIIQEIEVLKDPIVELDQRLEPNSPLKVKTKKKEPTTKCPHCGKEMLEKTFKYYHSLKCKKEYLEMELPNIDDEKYEKQQVEKEPKKEEITLPPKQITLQPASANRHVQRREYFKNLVKSAF
jgi:hypothetical protein